MSPENPLLSQAVQDVGPVSSPAPEGEPNPEGQNADPGPPAGNQGGSGDDDDKGGRSLDNVRGEFDRKLSKISGQMDEMRGMMQTYAQNPPTPAPVGVPDINNMSAAQLESIAPNIPAEQKDAYNRLLNTARNKEQVGTLIDSKLEAHDFDIKKRESTQEAFGLYPELGDPLSRFRQETNNVLNEMGAAARSNPYAMRHASDAAAARLGFKPRTTQQIHDPVGGRTGPAPLPDSDEGQPLSDEEISKLAKTFASAMPGGEFTPEQLARIKKNSALYRKHKMLFIKQ